MNTPTTPTDTIVVRRTVRADGPDLELLAQLDSALSLDGPVLVAESDGEPRAALELATGRIVADPFRPTAAHVALLRTHARTIAAGARRPARSRRVRRRLAPA